MKENQHVQAIPPDVLTQAQAKIQEVLVMLHSYLLALIPSERQGMPKMGEKTIGLVEKSCDFTQQNPNLVPPYLEISAFGVDFNDAHGLWTLHNTVLQLEEGISDTEIAAGSVAILWIARLPSRARVLQVGQDGGGAGHPRRKGGYEELKTRFPGGKHRTGASQAGETETETT